MSQLRRTIRPPWRRCVSGSLAARHERRDGRNRLNISGRTWRKTIPRVTGTSIPRRRTFAGWSAFPLSSSMFVSKCPRRAPAREVTGKRQADVSSHAPDTSSDRSDAFTISEGPRSRRHPRGPCPKRSVLEMRGARSDRERTCRAGVLLPEAASSSSLINDRRVRLSD